MRQSEESEHARDAGRTASTGPARERPQSRRPPKGENRDEILRIARALFAETGFERATIRAIARGAHVDPALVLHYFGSKAELFAAALSLPVAPGDIVAAALGSDDFSARDHLGETVVRAFLTAWEVPENRVVLVAMLRSAMTNDTALEMVRGYLTSHVFAPITRALGATDGDLRATLVGSQFIGLATLRYVARIEPLASAPVEWLVAAVAPTVQRYLTGPLSPGADAAPR